MKPWSYKKLITLLEAKGFVVVRKKGSHMIFKNQSRGIIVPVPLHSKNSPIPLGTFLAILKQALIDRKDLK